MRDSQLNAAERPVQRKFRLAASVGALLLLPILIVLAADRLRGMPSRQPLPERVAGVRFEALAVAGTAGAWTVTVDDPRFGGVSALAVDGSRLLALTDSGVVVTLPKPGRGAWARLRDLPDGPGSPHERRWRDSEALVRDRSGSWWVAFENRHSLWRYDPGFARAEAAFGLRRRGWALNKGVEAMVSDGSDALLLLPETGTELLRVGRRGGRRSRLGGVPGEVADAARLPDGRVLLLVRQVGFAGLVNQLGELSFGRDGGGQVRLLRRIPVGPLTNLEGIAVEPLPAGKTRLWLISDNDFSDLRRTVLLAVDLP